MAFYILILFTISFLDLNVQCANILCVFNIPSASHEVVFQPIWEELSLRGHNVTVITTKPIKDPSLVNLTEIDISLTHSSINEFKPKMSQTMNHWNLMKMMVPLTESFLNILFQHEEVMKLIKNNNTRFDVVIAEAMVPAVFVFASIFKCPLIGAASMSTFNAVYQLAGIPNHPLLYPDITTTFAIPTTFSEKVEAVIYDIWQKYFDYYTLYPLANQIVKKYLGQNTPKIEDIAKNMSVLFLNTNPILDGARPYGPNVIRMGRMHLKPKRPLPEVSI